MKYLYFVLLLAVGSVNAHYVDFQCDLPTQRENGNALAASEIDGVMVRYSVNNQVGFYDDTDANCSGRIENIPRGIITLAVATYDTNGKFSEWSDSITLTAGEVLTAPRVHAKRIQNAMAITHTIGTLYSSPDTALDHTVSIPAANAGDIIIIALSHSGNTSTNPPQADGYTLGRNVPGANGSGDGVAVFERYVTQSEPATTVDIEFFTGLCKVIAQPLVVHGAGNIIYSAGQTNPNGVTMPFESYTTTAANSRLLYAAGRAGTNMPSTGEPVGSTQIVTAQSTGGTATGFGLAYEDVAASGTTKSGLFWDTTPSSRTNSTVVVEIVEATGTGQTLDAENGGFNLTGIDAGLAVGVFIDAESAVFSNTSFDIGLLFGRQLLAENAQIIFNGIDATLSKNYIFSADSTAFTLSGIDAELQHDAGFLITAETTNLVLSGNADLLRSRLLIAESENISLFGLDAQLLQNYNVVFDAGIYLLSNTDINTLADRVLFSDVKTLAFSFTDSNLTYSNAGVFTDIDGQITLESLTPKITIF